MTANASALNAALSGRYTIERELGAGGMATVYLAQDIRHHRKVALKVLRPELSAILGAERFLAEIKTTANLQHPHILSLFDSGEADGTVFYVMPYVEGESLRDRLKREQQLPVDEAIRIAREVLDALEYAHLHGIVHRDIKPENILLHGGHAMVADFGIALAASKVEGGTRMTETGMSLGTPHYMSPEQAMGERIITPKADIYALGCVLYEMLTGEPPFTGSSAQAVFARVLTDEPRSLTLQRKTIPPHVEAAVKTALQKLPADRFASAREFSEALGKSDYSAPITRAGNAPPVRKAFKVAGWVAVAAAVSALAGGYAAGRGTAPIPRATPVHFTVTLPESVTQINRCCGPAQALSPDGKTLVFVGIRNGRGVLYRRSVDRLESELIPGTEEASIPFFSQNGQWLGFASAERLRKVAVSGGPSTPIAPATAVSGATWGDDDTIVFSQGNKLWTVPAAGGSPRAVPRPDTVSVYWYPSALPGGKRVLVIIREPNNTLSLDASRVGVVELATGKIDTIGFATHAVYASGYLVFSGADNTVLVQPFDPKKGKTTGPATVLLSGIWLSGSTLHEFTLSANGWLAYMPATSQSNETLRALGTGASTIPLPGRSGDNLEDPAISPDGRYIAVTLAPTSTRGRDIWILDRQQGTLTRFTVGGGETPVWSRDGKRIAYYVRPDTGAKPGIYVRSADQTGTPQLVLQGAAQFPASWLPGDRGLVIAARRPINYDIGVLTLGDTAPRFIVSSQFNEWWGQLSRDGRLLAFGSDRTAKPEIYVQPMTPGAAPTQISTDGGSSPRWSPDGRTLYYVQGGSIVAATLGAGPGIAVTSRRLVHQANLTDLNPYNVNWDISPDGKQFIYIDQVGLGLPRLAVIQNWPEMARAMGPSR